MYTLLIFTHILHIVIYKITEILQILRSVLKMNDFTNVRDIYYKLSFINFMDSRRFFCQFPFIFFFELREFNSFEVILDPTITNTIPIGF